MGAARKFQVMTLTDAAAERVRELVDNAGGDKQGLRVGVKKGGCAGMEYSMELADEARPGDDVIVDKGARLFVDPSAVLFLLGTEMDYEVTKFRSGFVFKNPNEVSACGCGESVSLQQADPSALEAAQGQ